MSKDMITYEGQDVNELRKDFEGAIDDYLALCKANGKAPRVPYSGNLNIRITPEIHSRIAMMAMRAGTTINGFIRDTLANVTGVTPAKRITLPPKRYNLLNDIINYTFTGVVYFSQQIYFFNTG